jgi:hypothetical protein
MKTKPNADHAPEARPRPMPTRPRAPCSRYGFRRTVDEEVERRLRKLLKEIREAEEAEKAEKGGGE